MLENFTINFVSNEMNEREFSMNSHMVKDMNAKMLNAYISMITEIHKYKQSVV
jgi:hypothetical protein